MAAEPVGPKLRSLQLRPGGVLSASRLRVFAWVAFAIPVCYVVLAPVLSLQARALANSFAGYREAAEIRGIGRVVWNTFSLGVGSVVIAVVMGTAVAWAVSRSPARYRSFLAAIPMVPLMIPPVAAVAGWAFLLSPRQGYINTLLRRTPLFDHLETGPFNVYTLTWIVITTGIILSAYVYMFVYTSLREIGEDYSLAAQASGASPARVFFTITLPLLRPAITYSAAIVFLLGLGQFTAPLLLGRQQGVHVVTTLMWSLTQDFPVRYHVGAALGAPLIALGVVVVILQRRFIGDSNRYVLAGSKKTASSDRSRAVLAPVVVGVYGLLASLLPLLALGYVSMSPYWTGSLSLDGLSLDHFRRLFNSPFAMEAIWTSVRVSSIAVAVLLPTGLLIAWGLWRRDVLPGWLGWILDVTVSIPVAVAASLLGFGILFTYTTPPLVLYGTETVLVITYFTLMIPFVTRLLSATFMGLGPEYFAASQASGASRTRTIIQIGLPLCRRGLGSAAALSVVLLIHEFSASLMVRSPTTQVMGSLLYDRWSGGSYPEVAVVALLMVGITAVGVIAARLISGRDLLKES